MDKIIISCDSVCDLSPELIRRYDVEVIPIHVQVGEKSYLDDGSISAEGIYRKFQNDGTLPQTAAFSPQSILEFFEKYTSEGYEIVHIDLSSNLSSCFQNASIAASSLEGVHVVDSRQLSTGMGLLVLEACHLRGLGFAAFDIAAHLNKYKRRIHTSFVLDTLDYMWKGGRCSGVTAMGANILQLKPCLEMRDGELKVSKKYRGKIERVVDLYLKDILNTYEIDAGKPVFLTTSGGFDNQFLLDIKHWLGERLETDDIYITQAGCTVASHCGPKTLGVLFVRQT